MIEASPAKRAHGALGGADRDAPPKKAAAGKPDKQRIKEVAGKLFAHTDDEDAQLSLADLFQGTVANIDTHIKSGKASLPRIKLLIARAAVEAGLAADDVEPDADEDEADATIK